MQSNRVKAGRLHQAALAKFLLAWHDHDMLTDLANQSLSRKLVESLMVEVHLLNDEVRSYFEGEGRDDRTRLGPIDCVLHASEALKATTKLMHMTAWLMSRRSVDGREGLSEARLGRVAESDAGGLQRLPSEAVRLIEATDELYVRIRRIEERLHEPVLADANPALRIRQNLEERLTGRLVG